MRVNSNKLNEFLMNKLRTVYKSEGRIKRLNLGRDGDNAELISHLCRENQSVLLNVIKLMAKR